MSNSLPLMSITHDDDIYSNTCELTLIFLESLVPWNLWVWPVSLSKVSPTCSSPICYFVPPSSWPTASCLHHTSRRFVPLATQRFDPQSAQRIVDLLLSGVDVPPAGKAGDAAGASSAASSGQPGPIVEIKDEADWNEGCLSSGLLCVLGFFNGQDESKIELFKEVAKLEASSPLRFSYVDGSCYTQFANAFDVQEYKLPTVAVYSSKKSR